VIGKIRPFDIRKTRKLTEIDDKCFEKVKDQEILLFLGGTGSGKSTSILYLCGCTMEKVDVDGYHNHIQAKEMPDGCDEELRNVVCSPHPVSETSNVRAINVKIEKKGFGSKTSCQYV